MALSDTEPEAERVQLELLRRAGPDRRLHLALSLSRTVMGLSRAGLARRYYGSALADALRADLASRRA